MYLTIWGSPKPSIPRRFLRHLRPTNSHSSIDQSSPDHYDSPPIAGFDQKGVRPGSSRGPSGRLPFKVFKLLLTPEKSTSTVLNVSSPDFTNTRGTRGIHLRQKCHWLRSTCRIVCTLWNVLAKLAHPCLPICPERSTSNRAFRLKGRQALIRQARMSEEPIRTSCLPRSRDQPNRVD